MFRLTTWWPGRITQRLISLPKRWLEVTFVGSSPTREDHWKAINHHCCQFTLSKIPKRITVKRKNLKRIQRAIYSRGSCLGAQLLHQTEVAIQEVAILQLIWWISLLSRNNRGSLTSKTWSLNYQFTQNKQVHVIFQHQTTFQSSFMRIQMTYQGKC